MKIYTLTLTIVTLLLHSLAAQKDYHLFLYSENQIPEEVVHYKASSQEIMDGYYYAVLQFYDIPSVPVREQLSETGIELLVYVPNYAWFSRIPVGQNLQNFPIRTIVPLSADDKIFPSLLTGSFPECLVENGGVRVQVLLIPQISKDVSVVMMEQAGFEILSSEGRNINLTIEVSQLETLAELPVVMAVGPQECTPEKEGIRGRTLARANGINGGTAYSGQGIPIAIADDGSVSHEDFRGRVADFTTADIGTHGDMTVGLAGGCGNINPKGVGMATASGLYLFDIEGYPHHIQAVENYINYDIEITSTSYGEGCGGYYNYTAHELDLQVYENNTFFHCFSAGNRGYDGCNETYGPFANEDATRFGNITGGRKAGKNTTAVGNVYYNDSLRVTSSRGPTIDGRIKPDICAPGQGNLSTGENNTYQSGGGTSAASPVIAGAAALMYEAYQEQTAGNSPPSGLIKAMMLCSAEDLGRPGPDYEYGWGRINVGRAMEILQNNQFITGEIEHSFQEYHQIIIPEGIGQARIMVYWMDPAGSVVASKALVNDIDISLQNGAGQVYLPHVLSYYPHYDSLTLAAYPGYDHVNNMEEVILDMPAPGSYTLRVKGHIIPEGPQQYFVVYTFIKDEIKVTYPFSGEGFVPGEKEVLRWDAYGTDGSFLVEYSLDGMNEWETIASDLPGHIRYLDWDVPQVVSGSVFIRVSRNDQEGYSDGSFTIIEVPSFEFDYVNETTAAISWYPVPGATSYEVFAIGEKFMELIGQTAGTSFSFPTQLWEKNWYSVRAVTNQDGKGMRAVAKAYTHYTCEANFGINFQFDLYPGEISWEVTSNEDGSVVMTGGPYDYLPPNSYINIQKCLPYGCYTFKMTDAYGDGICCDYGDGYYEFFGQDGQLLTTGGDFGGIKIFVFCLEDMMGGLGMNIGNSLQVSCNGGSDGATSVTALGGSGNYSYQWSNGATTSSITNLTAGIYTVTVNDGPSQLTTSITITEPSAIMLNIIPFNINCSTITAGSVLTDVSGGLPPYNYFWSTGASTPDISNLEAGTYNVSVVDANGCLMASGATVAQNNDLELSTTVVSPSCFGAANGVILATTIGGTGDYTYQWSNGNITAGNFGLTAGDYQVTVLDDNGCSGVKFMTVEEPDVLQIESIITLPNCDEGDSGSIELLVNGGTAPYDYYWNTGQTSYNLLNLGTGSYSVSVTDINNCTEQETFEVNISSPMALNFEVNSAVDGSDGNIDLNVTNGMPPYTFYWSNGETTEDINNLAGGLYSVTVTDAGGCQKIGEINVGTGEYCLLRGSNTNYEWIDRISWAGEDFVSGSDGGLGLYHNTIFTAVPGDTYAFEAEPDFSGAAFGEYWRIWIDFNGNYDFSDPGEEVFTGGPLTGKVLADIQIPIDATPGNTIMRIAMKYGSLPPLCGIYGYGEVEEYGILIQSNSVQEYGEQDEFGEVENLNHILSGVVSKQIKELPAVFEIYPNPATEYINISLNDIKLREKIRGAIFSIDGRKVTQLTNYFTQNESVWKISVNDLPEGIYRVELYGDRSVYIKRFIVSRK